MPPSHKSIYRRHPAGLTHFPLLPLDNFTVDRPSATIIACQHTHLLVFCPPGVLRYYEEDELGDIERSKPRNLFVLKDKGVTVHREENEKPRSHRHSHSQAHIHNPQHPPTEFVFTLQGPHEDWKLCAASKEEMDGWMKGGWVRHTIIIMIIIIIAAVLHDESVVTTHCREPASPCPAPPAFPCWPAITLPTSLGSLP
jgi:hypothetical protein